MNKKSVCKIAEVGLRWLSYISAVLTLIFAYFIYDQYNITSSIKNKEAEIVLDLLKSINSKTIYFESGSSFELDTCRKITYERVYYETTLPSVINSFEKDILEREILMDIRFQKYLTELREKYLHAPIPLQLKESLGYCINPSTVNFPKNELYKYTHFNLIGVNSPIKLSNMLMSYTESNTKKYRPLSTEEYFKRWLELHIILIEWLEMNSNIQAYKYYEKKPRQTRILFNNKRTN